MDTYLLRRFQRQAELQCRAVLSANQRIREALAAHQSAEMWIAVQELLSAGANISKAMWGEKGKHALARKPLRDSIGIRNDSPLRATSMRNNFDHFDERLDEWWRDSKTHNSADFIVGPPDTVRGIAKKERFRYLDPATMKLWFWGREYDIPAIVAEVDRILPALTAEASKPHWDPQTEDEKKAWWIQTTGEIPWWYDEPPEPEPEA